MALPADYYYLSGFQIEIAYVSASLKKAGFNVFTQNFAIDENPLKDALTRLITDYDISAVGCWGSSKISIKVKDVIDVAKKIKPSLITFIGGQLVTNSPTEAMTIIKSADYGIIGHGEITSCELMQALKANTNTSNIENIVYREKSGRLFVTDKNLDLPELDTIPFPDHEGFFNEIIKSTSTAVITTTRSCPSKCTFCSCNCDTYRLRSIKNVISEIDFLVKKYSIKKLTISDEVFSITSDRITTFCKLIIEYNLKWSVNLRLSTFLTSELLQVMKDSGCDRIFYGLESADDTILKSMKKGTSVPLMENILFRTKNAGIKTMGAYIFGDVEETEESVLKTLNWLGDQSDKIDAFVAGMIQCYPGSTIYKNAVKRRKIIPIDHIAKGCPPINISRLPDNLYNILSNEIIPIERARRIFKWPVWMGIDALFSKGDFGYIARCICPECRTEQQKDITTHKLYYSYSEEFICKNCKCKWVFFPILRYVNFIEDRLKAIIDKSKCAIWPVSRHFASVYESSIVLKKLKSEYILINKNENITGMLVLGNHIFNPEVLSTSNEIETVIVFSRYYKEIEKELLENYPHIKIMLFHEIGMKEELM